MDRSVRPFQITHQEAVGILFAKKDRRQLLREKAVAGQTDRQTRDLATKKGYRQNATPRVKERGLRNYHVDLVLLE